MLGIETNLKFVGLINIDMSSVTQIKNNADIQLLFSLCLLKVKRVHVFSYKMCQQEKLLGMMADFVQCLMKFL